jgi:hypothetical protein
MAALQVLRGAFYCRHLRNASKWIFYTINIFIPIILAFFLSGFNLLLFLVRDLSRCLPRPNHPSRGL